jgi:hypothetical protein
MLNVSNRPGLPTGALERLLVAIADFLQDPECETKLAALDWTLLVVAVKWGGYSTARRVEAAKNPIKHTRRKWRSLILGLVAKPASLKQQ